MLLRGVVTGGSHACPLTRSHLSGGTAVYLDKGVIEGAHALEAALKRCLCHRNVRISKKAERIENSMHIQQLLEADAYRVVK